MANNVTLSAGTADGAVIATDDITAVHYPYAKVGIGADDTFTILVGGTGVDAAGVLRVSLATNVALPAGTNAIGKLAANSGVDIGDVDVTSVIAGTGATNLGKAEDAAHTSADTGVMILAVREAAATDLSAGATDGDYEPLEVDASGRLWVHAGLVDTVTTVTTVSALGNSTTGPQKAEDVASANADVGIPAMAVQKATPANTAGTDGDYEFLQMSAGRLWASATIDAALPAGTNAIGKLAANSGVDIGDVDITSILPGSGATNLGKLEDAAHSSGDLGVMALAVRAASPTERSAGPTDGDYEPLGVNEVGALWTTPTPSVNGGLTTFMASGSDGSSILVATSQAVKASAGALYGYYVYNPEAAVTFLHWYNTAAASVTVGTTNPLMSFAVPAGAAANLSFPMGITFSNAGWSVAATTTAGGNTAPATGLSLVAWYK